MTTDAHDLINAISLLLGEQVNVLSVTLVKKCVNGWENLACHCLCLEGMMLDWVTHHFVLPVTSTVFPPCLFRTGYPSNIIALPAYTAEASGLGRYLYALYTVKRSVVSLFSQQCLH